jgi:hypothetical protein
MCCEEQIHARDTRHGFFVNRDAVDQFCCHDTFMVLRFFQSMVLTSENQSEDDGSACADMPHSRSAVSTLSCFKGKYVAVFVASEHRLRLVCIAVSAHTRRIEIVAVSEGDPSNAMAVR